MTITISIDDIIEYRQDTGRRELPPPRLAGRRIGIRYFDEGGEELRQRRVIPAEELARSKKTATISVIETMLLEGWTRLSDDG